MKTAFSFLWVLVLTTTAFAAFAATPEQESRAESLVAQAKERYQAGDFEHCAQLYMKAYGEVQRPAPVFNAARAYEQAGLWAEAKPLFELYLQIDRGEDADSLAGHADAQRHLDAVNAKIAADAAAHNAPPPPVAKPVPPDLPPVTITPPPVTHSPVIVDPPMAEPPKDLADLSAQQPTDDTWSGKKQAAVVTLSVGGVLIVTSIAIAIIAHSDLANLDARLQADQVANNQGLILHSSVTQVQMDSGISTYNARQIAAGVLGGVGAAAVVVGGYLLWQDGQQSNGHVALSTGVVPNQGGAVWTLAGHF